CLLDPGALFARNKGGMNVVLFRFEDWKRFHEGTNGNGNSLGDQVKELIGALETAARRIASPILVCVCPASTQALNDPERATLFDQAEKDLVAALAESPMIRCVSSN